jgi:hypothetical protein
MSAAHVEVVEAFVERPAQQHPAARRGPDLAIASYYRWYAKAFERVMACFVI